MIAWRPGNRSVAFKFNLDGSFNLLPCKYYSRLGVIDKVLVAKSKLVDPERKKILLVEEKSVDIWMELLKTFCRIDGFSLMVSEEHCQVQCPVSRQNGCVWFCKKALIASISH